MSWIVSTIGLLCVLGWSSVAAPQALIAADVEAGRRKAEVCAQCHGPNGNSTKPAVPSLAGQPALYTHWQLIFFRDGRRKDTQMSPFAANLTDADMQDIAGYYAAQTPAAPHGTSDPAKAGVAKRLVKMHHCDSCHARGLVGQRHIPRLAGQPYEYLLKQLREFKAQTRAEVDSTMTAAAQPLSEEDIETLAYYIAHLPPIP